MALWHVWVVRRVWRRVCRHRVGVWVGPPLLLVSRPKKKATSSLALFFFSCFMSCRMLYSAKGERTLAHLVQC